MITLESEVQQEGVNKTADFGLGNLSMGGINEMLFRIT
jgi:hypothetical protein